ncbi:MAG: MATE family efflux transporter [Verrucomicrobia bacterium]|nr:MATE family efflux transporter [Verrucomicrobiota bacterium]MCF7707585.1 MATE family efflux transporter [Verrucomicrobiota bacterium]
MRTKQRDLTQGSIAPMLIKLVWPMVFGMLGMVVFNLADTYFLGMVGVNELAAIGFTFPVVLVIGSMAIGIGIGVSSLISRTINVEERSVIKQYATSAIVLGLLVISVFVIVGLLTIRPMFRALGATPSVLPLIEDYMRIWYWGMIFVVIPMVGNNIIRATGDTFTPGMIMTAAALVNIVLDPILILGYGPIPAMSIKGAAVATVIARASGFVITFYILVVREKLLAWVLPAFVEVLEVWKKILYIALPATASILIIPLSIGIITRIVAEFGEEAVAAFGVVSRLEMFSLVFVNALGSVMVIFAGQNWGKARIDRLLKGFDISIVFAMCWGMMLFVVSQLWSEQVAGVFSDNETVVGLTAKYLVIVSFSYGFHGVLMIGINILNGINRPLPSALLMGLRMFGLYVPFAYVAALYGSLIGIFWSAFAANIVSGVVTYTTLKNVLVKSVVPATPEEDHEELEVNKKIPQAD